MENGGCQTICPVPVSSFITLFDSAVALTVTASTWMSPVVFGFSVSGINILRTMEIGCCNIGAVETLHCMNGSKVQHAAPTSNTILFVRNNVSVLKNILNRK